MVNGGGGRDRIVVDVAHGAVTEANTVDGGEDDDDIILRDTSGVEVTIVLRPGEIEPISQFPNRDNITGFGVGDRFRLEGFGANATIIKVGDIGFIDESGLFFDQGDALRVTYLVGGVEKTEDFDVLGVPVDLTANVVWA